MGRVQVQITESTGKRWKALQAVGGRGPAVGLLLLWLAVGLANRDGRPHEILFNSAVMLVGSIVVWMIGRVGVW